MWQFCFSSLLHCNSWHLWILCTIKMGYQWFWPFYLHYATLIYFSLWLNLCHFLEPKAFSNESEGESLSCLSLTALLFYFNRVDFLLFFPWQSCTFLQQLLPHSWLLWELQQWKWEEESRKNEICEHWYSFLLQCFGQPLVFKGVGLHYRPSVPADYAHGCL